MTVPFPAVAWMESSDWHVTAVHWATKAYALTAPQINVRGRMALFLASAILWSLGWLLYRAWQVVQTPNDVLVDKLGLDIPPAPEVTLEEILETEVQITWKLLDLHSSIQKHIVQVNGSKVGETKRHETAVSIIQLNPASFYDVRVFTVSAAGFQTPSSLVRLRTLGFPRKPEQDCLNEQLSPTLRVNPIRNLPLPSPSAPAMARESSGGTMQARRPTIGKKHALAAISHDLFPAQVEDPSKFSIGDEGDDSLAQLSERFQKIQQDNEAAEAQIAEEEKEFEASLKELEVRRDELKQSLKERDEASNDLKKQVHKMESANRAAQNEKSKKEKLLQQKEGQRKKRRDDRTRWKEQTLGIQDELARIEAEIVDVDEKRVKGIDELKQQIKDEQQEVKLLDESIKDRGSQIKTLEEERKRLHAEDENDESREADRLELERDRQWQEKVHNLNATYASLCNALGLAKSQFEAARERLAWCENARRNNPVFAPVTPIDLELSRKAPNQRRTRHRSSLASNISSPSGPFPTLDSPYSGIGFTRDPVHPSPPFSSGSAFFNMSNGMALGEMPDPGVPTAEDIDILTGGAPMSPRADALIPANLLGDEESQDEGDDEDSSPTSPISHTKRLSGLGPPTILEDEPISGSPSPASSSSRSVSFFQSPRESLQNISESQDAEGSSIRSTKLSPIQASPPEKGQSASQKLTGLFSFNRQRGKTSADEPPMLGTLKPGQSQSFPRHLGDGLEPLGTQRRRRLSHTGGWANGMTNLFPRPFSSEDKDQGLSRGPSSRRTLPSLFSASKLNPSNFGKSPFDPFSANADPTDPSLFGAIRTGASSPRPSSTYSFDRLPRPSSDSQPFGWGPPEKSNLRGSPLGPDWSTALSWSRSQSRRPSFQYGSTSNLSLGAPPAEDDDYVDDPRDPVRPLQAPIGTRPPSSRRPVTPKLNPAAPSFRTLFSKKTDKEKEKVKPKDLDGAVDTVQEPSLEDASPPGSRMSKDARSITTAHSMASTSMADSRESLDRTPSGTPSEATPATRETFIQKITRKSSSTKFNSWKDKGGLFSRKGEPSAPGEIDEEVPSDIQLGRSVESGTSLTPSAEKEKGSRSSLSWNFMRKNKKSDKGASEISESSELASETGEESVHESVHDEE